MNLKGIVKLQQEGKASKRKKGNREKGKKKNAMEQKISINSYLGS